MRIINQLRLILTRCVTTVPYTADHAREQVGRSVGDETLGRRQESISAAEDLQFHPRGTTAHLVRSQAHGESRVDHTQTVWTDDVLFGTHPSLDAVTGLRCARVPKRTQLFHDGFAFLAKRFVRQAPRAEICLRQGESGVYNAAAKRDSAGDALNGVAAHETQHDLSGWQGGGGHRGSRSHRGRRARRCLRRGCQNRTADQVDTGTQTKARIYYTLPGDSDYPSGIALRYLHADAIEMRRHRWEDCRPHCGRGSRRSHC